MNHWILPLAAASAIGLAMSTSCQSAGAPPVELGHVDWQRNYERGLELVNENHKPMLLLFQEVPG